MKSAAAFMLAFIVCFLTATVAFGQYRADQGKPGTQGPWSISPVAPWAVVGPDAGSVPVTLPVTQTGAFGEVFTAEAEIPLFLSFPYNVISPEAVTVANDGGATVSVDGGHIILQAWDGGAYAQFRSRGAARYVPGQGIATRFTFVGSPCTAGQQKTIGVGDDDGFFFGCCATCETDGGATFGILRRSTLTGEFWTPANQWNGPWGTTPPDITKGRPYEIQYQWLGYGAIQYLIKDAVTGGFVVAHTIRYAGTTTETSVANPTLPLGARIDTFDSGVANVLRIPSMSFIRQGHEPETGLRRTASSVARTLTTTEQPVLNVKNNPTTNGRVNRTQMRLDFLSYVSTGPTSADITVRLRLNPTVTGAAFTNVSSPYSIAAFASGGTNVPDGGFYGNGVEWFSLVVGGDTQGVYDLRQYNLYLAPSDVLGVMASTGSGSPTIRVSVSWVEEY